MSKKASKSGMDLSNYYKNRLGYQGPYAEYEQYIVSCLSPGKNILDVGCGRTFPNAGMWLSTGANVYGLDPVIDVGSLPQDVKGVKGSAEKIDYPDESFDLIAYSDEFVHSFQRKPATDSEAIRSPFGAQRRWWFLSTRGGRIGQRWRTFFALNLLSD